MSIHYYCLKVIFLVFKPRWYLDNKLITFQQFFNNGKRLILGVFLIQKAFCGFPAFPGFHFLPQSILENPETTENFHKLIFQGIKTIYLILSTALGILFDQDTTLKVLLKVTKENLRLKLEVAFLLLKPKLYLDNKVIAFYQFSRNGNRLTLGAFLIQKPFCRFPAFPGFRLLPQNIFENAESTENFILTAF